MFNSGLTTKNPPFSQLFNLLRLHFDRCTFVKDYNNFWTQVPATGMVRVGRAAAPVTPAYQAPTTYSRDQASYPYVPPVSTTTTRIVSTSTVASTTPWSFSKPVLKEGPLFAPAIVADTWLIFFRHRPLRPRRSFRQSTRAVAIPKAVSACRAALASKMAPARLWSRTRSKANVTNLNCGLPILHPIRMWPSVSPMTNKWATIAWPSARCSTAEWTLTCRTTRKMTRETLASEMYDFLNLVKCWYQQKKFSLCSRQAVWKSSRPNSATVISTVNSSACLQFPSAVKLSIWQNLITCCWREGRLPKTASDSTVKKRLRVVWSVWQTRDPLAPLQVVVVLLTCGRATYN